VLTGVRTPRMNSIIECWVKRLRAELLDCMLASQGAAFPLSAVDSANRQNRVSTRS
jgi:hypothetical protein